MRIPSNIAVGLGIIAVAFTVGDIRFLAIAQLVFSVLGVFVRDQDPADHRFGSGYVDGKSQRWHERAPPDELSQENFDIF